MEFKIDTKKTYTLVCPVSESLNANLTAQLMDIYNNMGQSGSKNFLIDLNNCRQMDKDALPQLLQMHNEFYSNGNSLVFTGLNDSISANLKNTDGEAIINICPTMAEAIDVINMEILERDLFNEE